MSVVRAHLLTGAGRKSGAAECRCAHAIENIATRPWE